MKGILPEINWSILIEKPLEAALRKYSLTKDNPEVVFSNSTCSIKFWASDYQAFKWVFFNPNAKHVYYYDISKYIEYILYSKIPRWINVNKPESIEELTVEIFKYYNNIIIDYLDKPLKGDFTWHQNYIIKNKVQLRLVNYAFNTLKSHSEERRNISRSFIRNEVGAKSALLEYLSKKYPNQGTVLEIYHEDSSIHQLMVKFKLEVPFYFSYNNEFFKVVERDEEDDFGQVYYFSKFYKKFITPLRCDFAIQSKFERIEFFTEKEFDRKIKDTLTCM